MFFNFDVLAQKQLQGTCKKFVGVMMMHVQNYRDYFLIPKKD